MFHQKVEALQYNKEGGAVCPENWTKGKTGMCATHDGDATNLADAKN